jgi:ABC-type oligopeptide transport system substrate-binding subunit
MANNRIEVTFYKDTKVDSKLYKAGEVGFIPENAAKVYEGKRLSIGKVTPKKQVKKAEPKAEPKKPKTKSNAGKTNKRPSTKK